MTRIPEQSLVQTKPWIVDEDDPILQFIDRSKVVIRKSDGTTYDKYLATPPVIGEGTRVSTAGQSGATDALFSEAEILRPDTVDLTDIEGDPIFEQYYDPLTKLIKYKVTLKIRNSSYKKANVKGVDARIYNPGA